MVSAESWYTTNTTRDKNETVNERPTKHYCCVVCIGIDVAIAFHKALDTLRERSYMPLISAACDGCASLSRQVRNELTSAEFALNLNGATRGSSTGGGGGTPPAINGQSTGPGAPSASAAPASAATPGSKSEIDFEMIAERLEASLRALQAGRPLSLLEAVSPDEVRNTHEGAPP